MDCDRHNQNLSALLDGRLSRSEASHLEAHVRICRRCNEDLAELKRLKQVLAALPDAEPSPGFWSETIHQVRSARPSRRTATRTRIRHALAISACIGSILLVTVLESLEAPTSKTRPSSEPTTIHADSLVALHTSLRTEMPLADTGTLRFARTDGIVSDWANDHQLDIE